MDSTINLSADTSDKIEQKYAFKDFFFFFPLNTMTTVAEIIIKKDRTHNTNKLKIYILKKKKKKH